MVSTAYSTWLLTAGGKCPLIQTLTVSAMQKHNLKLFENAIDSLNESLELVNSAQSKGVRRYKFAILNFCHFAELLFKYFAWKFEPHNIVYTTKKERKKLLIFGKH